MHSAIIADAQRSQRDDDTLHAVSMFSYDKIIVGIEACIF
jgi:hypothetical protein